MSETVEIVISSERSRVSFTMTSEGIYVRKQYPRRAGSQEDVHFNQTLRLPKLF